MTKILVLLAALTGQAATVPVAVNDGNPRGWLKATIGGKTTDVWGWLDPQTQLVRYHQSENPWIFAPAAPAAKPTQIGAGLVLESTGQLNAGLDLRNATQPMGAIETNDPEFGQKLGLEENCSPDGCDEPDVDRRPLIPSKQPDYTYVFGAIAVAIVVAGVLSTPKGQT